MTTTISERATANVSQMDKRDRPLSERFRLAGNDWVAKHRAAELLEELKSSTVAQMVLNRLNDGPVPFNRAEIEVKASAAYREYVEQMVEARSVANKARVTMDTLRYMVAEWQADDANQRAERRTSRAQP